MIFQRHGVIHSFVVGTQNRLSKMMLAVLMLYQTFFILTPDRGKIHITGRARLIQSHSSARICFELSGTSN